MIKIFGLLLVFVFLSALSSCKGFGSDIDASGKEDISAEKEETEGSVSPDKGEDPGENPGGFDFQSKTVILNSGYEMPIMGLGTYSLTDEECYNSVTALLEAGGRLIDTAYMYHNEESVGRAVEEDIRESC